MNDELLNMGNASAMQNINPLEFESVKCPKCGNEIFIPGVMFKNIPGVMLGMGAEPIPYPIKVAICSECHSLAPAYEQMLKKNNKADSSEKQSTSASGLII